MPAPRPRSGASTSRSFGAADGPSGSFPAAPIPASGDFPCERARSASFPARSRANSADAFERRDALARDGLELGAKLGRVVGDQLGPVTRPADFHVKRFLRGEMRMPRLHGGDHIVHRAPLERMHGRRPGVIEMAQLRVVSPELERLAVLQLEGHPAVPDREHLGGAAVHQPQPGIVSGPADAVAGTKLDPFCPLDLAAAAPPADLARLAGVDRIELLGVAHQHHAGDAKLARDPQEVPRLHGRGERAFVDHQHGLRECGAHLLRALACEPSRGKNPGLVTLPRLWHHDAGASPGLSAAAPGCLRPKAWRTRSIAEVIWRSLSNSTWISPLGEALPAGPEGWVYLALGGVPLGLAWMVLRRGRPVLTWMAFMVLAPASLLWCLGAAEAGPATQAGVAAVIGLPCWLLALAPRRRRPDAMFLENAAMRWGSIVRLRA